MAEGFAAMGARVAAAARRLARLEALAGGTPIECDVRDEAACGRAVAAAIEALGGLDALVYSVGIAPLGALRESSASDWREAFETNVVGASLLTRAALPALVASRGRAVYLSSIAAGEQPPRPGLGLYAATKAALDRLVAIWQVEQPEVAFTRVTLGDTLPTEMASDWDPAQAARYLEQWSERGLLFGSILDAGVVADHVANVLAGTEAVPVTSVVPRYPRD
jgi:NAD(P)-dependent dehydrogenase (short-subunit alcohol dehydrogenase family)